jgi:integrase
MHFCKKGRVPVYENKHRPITDDERRMILETIPKHYAGTMVLTMLCCGLRPIEIRRMKWDWIDFENAILTVGKSKTEAGTGRKIPIPPVLLDALKEHKAKELNNEYVFVKYEKHTRMDDNRKKCYQCFLFVIKYDLTILQQRSNTSEKKNSVYLIFCERNMFIWL